MNKQINLAIIFIGLMLFSISLISAVDIDSFDQSMSPQKLYEPIIITQGGDNGTASFSWCNISSLRYPNQTIIISNVAMTSSNGEFSYVLDAGNVTVPGQYIAYGFCDGYSFKFDIPVTPTGVTQKSILENPVLIILFLISLILLVLGFYTKNPPIVFIAGILITISGIYTMIYGFNDYTDMYTRAAAFVIIALGSIFTIASAYEWMAEVSGQTDTDEAPAEED